MDKIIGVTELQRNFRRVLDEVVEQHAAYILTRGSRPEAVIIPYDQYQRFITGNESEVLARIEKLLQQMALTNAKYSDEEVESDLQQATRELRERKRA